MLKRIIKFAAVGIIFAFLSLVSMFVGIFVIAPTLDERAAEKYKNEVVEKLELHKDLSVVSAKSGCANTGNGNHTEIIACVLIKTELTEKEMKALFEKEKGARLLTVEEFRKIYYMEMAGICFNELEKAKVKPDYYVVEFIDSAPFSEFDIKGM